MSEKPPLIIGRYAVFDEIAAGGMATVHLGRLVGAVGFSRLVAVKRLHPHLSKDPDFVAMFVDEARLAARIRHPNVVPTLDVVQTDRELFLVMEYVVGESLSRLMRAARELGEPVTAARAAAIAGGVLHGLHAAHTARGERGEPLDIVHRDVSPANVLVGTDGIARVLDFGVAKARVRSHTTKDGAVKGKLAYMAPEQLMGTDVGAHSDVYAVAALLWEMLAGRKLFEADDEAGLMGMVLRGATEPPSRLAGEIPEELDEVVMKGLAADPRDRFASARDMAAALEKVCLPSTPTELGEWVERLAGVPLSERALRVAAVESKTDIKRLAHDALEEATPFELERNGTPTRAGQRDEPEEPTQLSSSRSRSSVVEIVGAARATAKRKDAWRAATFVGAALGLVAIVLAVSLRGGDGTSGAADGERGGGVSRESALTSSATRPDAAGAVATGAEPAAAVVDSSSEPAPPVPTAAQRAEPEGTATARPEASGQRPRPRAGPSTASASSSLPDPAPAPASCDPPYTVDAEGIRHPKLECLH